MEKQVKQVTQVKQVEQVRDSIGPIGHYKIDAASSGAVDRFI